jgi:hypothetical protein
MRYGLEYDLKSSQARHIQWAQLTRPMATTHSNDTQQRIIDLPFERHGFCHLRVQMPSEPNLAPPGWYMLTIVDENRIPSHARWVHVHHA